MITFQMPLFDHYRFFIENSTFLRKYDMLFESLSFIDFPDKNTGVGRTGYSDRAILKAIIVKYMEEIKSVPRLIEYLDSNPVLTGLCGFEAGKIPDASQFYRFLNKTPNTVLQNLHQQVNQRLIDQDLVTLDTFIMDSKPVLAATRENNLKNPNRNCWDKNKKPKRNPTATLSYYCCGQTENNKLFFWGYRTHVLVTKEGIALVEITLPNNVPDEKVAHRLIKKLKRLFRFKKNSIFIADKAYDCRELYTLIVDTMKSQAFIPLNPRNTQDKKLFSPNGTPLCEAGLEMKPAGVWTEGLRKRSKFRCPAKSSPSELCPINNPRFANLYGCTINLDITDDARSQIQRGTDRFKEIYRQRQTVEQYFSRLGDREVEQTTHYKLRTVQNQMTIAHLSMSLVAAAAGILLKQPEKIRCYRTFADRMRKKVA